VRGESARSRRATRRRVAGDRSLPSCGTKAASGSGRVDELGICSREVTPDPGYAIDLGPAPQSPLRGTAVLASRSAAGDLAGSSSRWEDQAAYSSSGTAPCRVGRRGGTPRPPPSARSCAVGRHRRCTYVSKDVTAQTAANRRRRRCTYVSKDVTAQTAANRRRRSQPQEAGRRPRARGRRRAAPPPTGSPGRRRAAPGPGLESGIRESLTDEQPATV
jgi:hypothetical protein